MARAIPIGWPGLIGKWRSIFLGFSHSSLTGRFGIWKATHASLDQNVISNTRSEVAELSSLRGGGAYAKMWRQTSRLYEKRQRSLSIGRPPKALKIGNGHYQSFVRAVTLEIARWRCDVFEGEGDRNSTILMQLFHLMVQKSRISHFRSMWKDEFLPSSIKREIGDRAVTNQASSHCSEDLTTSRRRYREFVPLKARLFCQLFEKGQTAMIDIEIEGC